MYPAVGSSPDAATGLPDGHCGDNPGAWAPASVGLSGQWLELTYSTPVHTIGIDVFETNRWPFVSSVTLYDLDGGAHVLTGLQDNTSVCPGPYSPRWAATPYLVNRVRLDIALRDSYQEVDAVQLLGGGCDGG
jgi:hypothetical protein